MILRANEFIKTSDGDDAIGINRAIEALPEQFHYQEPRGHAGIIEFDPRVRYTIRSPIKLSGRTMLCSSHPTMRVTINADSDSSETSFGEWMVEGQYSNDVVKRANGNFGCGIERMNFFAMGKFKNGVQIGMSKNGGGIKAVGVFHPAEGGIGFNLLRSSDAVEIHDLMIESYPQFVGAGGVGFKCDVMYCMNAFIEVTGYKVGLDLTYLDACNLTLNIEGCELPLRATMPEASTITMGAGPTSGKVLAEFLLHKYHFKKFCQLNWSKNQKSKYENIKVIELTQGNAPTGKETLIPIHQGMNGTGGGTFNISDYWDAQAVPQVASAEDFEVVDSFTKYKEEVV